MFLRYFLFLMMLSLSQVGVADSQLIEAVKKIGRSYDVDHIEVLIKAGANVNFKGDSGRTALMAAASTKTDWEEKIDILLKAGAKVDLKDDSGQTALMIALGKRSSGIEEKIDMLLKAGAKVDLKDDLGNTALMLTATERQIFRLDEVAVEMLLKAGAKVNLKNSRGSTALMLASYYGKEGVVNSLLKAGAKVNLKNDLGETALILASRMRNVVHGRDYELIVDLLLKAGANVNAEDDSGNNALSNAHARSSSPTKSAIVKILLKAGALCGSGSGESAFKEESRKRHLASSNDWLLGNWQQANHQNGNFKDVFSFSKGGEFVVTDSSSDQKMNGMYILKSDRVDVSIFDECQILLTYRFTYDGDKNKLYYNPDNTDDPDYFTKLQ